MDLEKYLKPNKSVTGDIIIMLVGIVMAIIDFVMFIINAALHHPFQSIFFILMVIVFIIIVVISARHAQLMTDYQQFRYRVLKIGKNEVTVRELGTSWQKSDDYVRTAVARFIEKGLLPQGKLTDDGDTIVIAKPLEGKTAGGKGKGKGSDDVPDFNEIMAGFGKDVENISIYTESITHEDIKQNLNDYADSSKKIKEYLLEHQDNVKKARKFISIYTPSAVKLAESVKKAEDTGADEGFFTKASETSKNLAALAKDVFSKLQDNNLLDETIEMQTLDQMINEDMK